LPKFTLSLLDSSGFGLTIGRCDKTEFQDILRRVRAFPERRWLAEHKVWRIPTSPANIEYLKTEFDIEEWDADPEARTVLNYEELNEQRQAKKQTHRWDYIFKDEVPDITYSRSITTPYNHQIVALDALHNTEYFGLLMEMGTGKTKVIVDECFWQAHDRMGDPPFKVLIVCPMSIMGVWMREFKKHRDPDITYFITKVWTQHRGMQNLIDGAKAEVPLKVFITSIDRVKSMLEPLKTMNFDLCVLDESTRIKNPRAQRTKACIELAQACKRRAILTGAPLVNNILDLWAQFEFLKPASLGYESFYKYRDRYSHFTRSDSGYVKIHGARRLDELKERMASASFVVTKEQCLDLPKKTPVTHEVEMSEKQKELYDQMKEEALATLESTESEAVATIVQLLRLRQICSGFLVDVEGKTHHIEGATTKLDEIDRIFDEIGWHSKIIIWAAFKYDHHVISSHLSKKGLNVEVLNGDTKEQDRDTIEDRFNEGNLQVIVGEPGTGGLGLTLIGNAENRCHIVIYYSSDYALEKRIQSEDRCHRIGQDRPVTYIDICCENSIDYRIAEALQNKRDLSEYVKDMSTIKELLL